MNRSCWVIAVVIACLFAGLASGAEPVSVLLEKGIYTEETAGDVAGAINIYEQIVTNEAANRAAVAEAYYRLGSCLLKKKDNARAQEAFNAVVAQFSDQPAFVAKAQQKLGQLNTELMSIQPAPWKDGEVMRLNLKSATGMEMGTMIWTAKADSLSGQPVWQIEQRLFVSANNMQQFTRVVAKKDSFVPISGLTENQLGQFLADYGDKSVALKTSIAGNSSTSQVAVDRVVYDNEQALYLIRRLPLAVGYKASFPIFPVTGGTVVDCRIEVTGKEKLTVPAGTFDCLKLTLSVYAQNVQALQHHLWFSADANRFLVRYDSGQAVMDLLETAQGPAKQTTAFADPGTGISLTLPPGWLAYKNPSPGAYKLYVQFLPPELKAWASLIAAPRLSGTFLSCRAAAEGDISVLKSYFKNYTVRPNSWTGPATGDSAPVSYAADYDDQGKAMVEYRTYILSKSTVYWFVFRIRKNVFEAEKTSFDAILTSFRIPESDRSETHAQTTTDAQPSHIANTLERELTQARVDMQVRKERLDQVEKMTEAELANASGFIVAEPIIAGIRKQLGEVKVEIESALSGAKDANDAQVKGLEAQRAKLEEQLHDALEGLKKGLRVDYEVARKKVEALQAAQPTAGVADAAGPKTVSEADRLASERLAMGAWKLWQQQKPAEAEPLFQQAVERDPDNADAWNGLGWARQNQGLPANARAAFEKCLALKPTHPAALNGMGWIAKAEGNNDEAIRYWKRAVQASPGTTAALFGLATAYRDLGDNDQAVTYARQLLAVEPANVEAARLLKEAETKAGARKTDKIDYPFVNDPTVLGRWISMDFVKTIDEFNPDHKAWQGETVLKGLTFLADGKMPESWWTWTKGLVLHHGDQTASKYVIKKINKKDFLFIEWKSGDYTLRGMKPSYYVLIRSP